MNGDHHQAVVRVPSGLECRRVPTPAAPRPGDAVVRMEFVGVCGTDLQILSRERPAAARILGHEGTGVVTDLGDGVPRSLLGRRVVFNPVNPAAPDEVLGHSYDGLLQQRFLVPARLLPDLLVVVEPAVPARLAVLAEPLATAVYGFELVREVCEPNTVVVIGGGPTGLLYAVYLRASGVTRVLLVHRRASRLAWAKAAGVVRDGEAVLADDARACGVPPALEGQADAAFLCTNRGGAADGFRTARALVRSGGCVDFVTAFPEGVEGFRRFNEIRRANACGAGAGPGRHHCLSGPEPKKTWLTGHRGTSPAHVREALRHLEKSPELFGKLVTDQLSMARAARELPGLARDRGRRLSDGRETVKVLVELADSDH
jgi:threonine dehydrogenase-like Zn-dependent dehydrogenase